MAGLEERMAKVEGILEEVRSRLDHLEERLDRQFLWLMGVIITMWVTLILTVLFRR